MSEQPSTLLDHESVTKLVGEAKNRDEILNIRELVQLTTDLGKTAITSENGDVIDVKSIGSEKLAEFTRPDPDKLETAMAVSSSHWRNEEK